MNDLFPSGIMPRRLPRTWMIFNILMLAALFIGLLLGGYIGLLVGITIACFGLIWFFFIHKRS